MSSYALASAVVISALLLWDVARRWFVLQDRRLATDAAVTDLNDRVESLISEQAEIADRFAKIISANSAGAVSSFAAARRIRMGG